MFDLYKKKIQNLDNQFNEEEMKKIEKYSHMANDEELEFLI